jgi:Zn-dependent oligopeptidase
LYPEVAENAVSVLHIFSRRIFIRYYSYKWAEVLDADAFEYFSRKRDFDKEVATKFKENVFLKEEQNTQ